MALIVEDGSVVANAEAYITVAEADAYFSSRNMTTWATLSTGDKEAAIRRAADYMQQTYRTRWAGYRYSDSQTMDWPRAYVPRNDSMSSRSTLSVSGYGGFGASYYPTTVVPKEVKTANAELAIRGAAGPLLDDLAPPTASESVGSVSVSYFQGDRKTVSYPAVDRLLAPLLKGMGGISLARG